MLKKASDVLGRLRRDRLSHRFDQRFSGACLRLAQQCLDLLERFLYRVVLRRVGR